MNRLTNNDKNFGPFTFAKWGGRLSAELSSNDDYGSLYCLLLVGFGGAMRIALPSWIRAGSGRNSYGFSISKMDDTYNFLSIYYGAQTWDSKTEKRWSCHFPWTEWEHVRFSLYNPDGTQFWTQRDRQTGLRGFDEQMKQEEAVPKSCFGFKDYDGELIVATCHIEEREWHRGRGWFKWLRYFTRPIIRRSLSLKFSAEVGPDKGSWKGGTTGHGVEMLSVETPRQAFERHCKKEHRSKNGPFRITFVGPCSAPTQS